MDRELRREVLKLIQANKAKEQANANGLIGSAIHRISGNSVAAAATIPTATTAGGGALCVMLALMPVEMSGLFDVKISTAITGITTGDSIDYLVSTDQIAAPLRPTLLRNVAFGGPTATDLVTPGSMFTNHGSAAGISYTNGNAGAPGITMFDSGAQVAVTTALNQTFGWDGTVGVGMQAATGLIQPFIKGNLAVIMLYTNISAGGATWQGLSVDIMERYA
jgi:hypothetical protein